MSFGPALSSATTTESIDTVEWITKSCQTNSLECVRVCAGSECCFDGTAAGDCSEDCTKYASCSILHVENDNSQGTVAVGDNTSSGSNSYTVEMITDACLNHDNSIVNLCSRVCDGSDCCFDGSDNCGVDCGKYTSCSTLHDSSAGDNPVDAACAGTDVSECLQACGDSSCCFTTNPDKSCVVANPGILCSKYSACEKLYVGGT